VSSSPVLDVAAVVAALVVVPVPEHHAAVVGRLLHRRQQAKEDPATRVRVRRRPLVPLLLTVRGCARTCPCPVQRFVDEAVRERAVRCSSFFFLLFHAGTLLCLAHGERLVVLQEEVHAVEPGVSQGPARS
jgi:hypothetical protein